MSGVSDSMELPTETCGSYFLVEAEIDGRPGIPLLLDTGAGSTHLDPAVMRELGIGQRIDSLRIGDFVAWDFAVRPLDMEQLGAALGRDVAGILGHPVFGGLTIVWDFPRRTIRLTRDTLPAGAPGVVAARRNRRPFVRASVGGETRWVLVDTGSGFGLTLRDPAALPLLDSLRVTGARVRADGVHLVRAARLDGTARVGPIRLENPVLTGSVSVDLIGQKVLRHLRISMDGRTHRIRFERPDAPLEVAIESPGVTTGGFALDPAPGYATVGWVDSVAAEAGLRVGDRVVEIDGVPWADRGCSAREANETERADAVELGVVRDGRRLRVVVPMRTVLAPGSGAGGDAAVPLSPVRR